MSQLIEFLLFVFASSIVINGWYEITRNGKIFGFWERFWEHFYFPNDDNTNPPVYRFPYWLRSPISQCIMCMSSIYGTIIFLITILVFNNHELRLQYTTLQVFFIYVAYLLSLTVVNYYIHKKIK